MSRLSIAAAVLVAFAVPALAQGPSANVADLAWMPGTYANDTLEENWATPKGGSMASLVRGYDSAGVTNMIELIVVEEEGDSLILRLKQWNPGMEPRADFQVMDLIEIGDRKVVFKNRGEGIPQLGYSLDGNTFTISIATPNRDIDIPLTRVSPH